MKLIGSLAKRIKYFVGLVENLTLSNLSSRFIKYLVSLSEQQRTMEVTLPVKKVIWLFCSVQHQKAFSRMLKKLKDDGVIDIDGRKIKILKVE